MPTPADGLTFQIARAIQISAQARDTVAISLPLLTPGRALRDRLCIGKLGIENDLGLVTSGFLLEAAAIFAGNAI